MPATVGVVVDLREVSRMLEQLQQLVSNPERFFREVLDPDVTKLLEEQFESRGARLLGSPWAPLSPTTVKLRTRVLKAGGGKGRRSTTRVGRGRAGFATPLRDTLRLWAAYVKAGGPGSLRIIDKLRYERGVLGGAVPYAAPQHSGFTTRLFGKGPERKVPARPVIPNEMPLPVLKAWEGQLARWITANS